MFRSSIPQIIQTMTIHYILKQQIRLNTVSLIIIITKMCSLSNFIQREKIDGYKPDKTVKDQQQYTYFNQFRVGPFLPIKPDSSYFAKLVFNVPKHTNIMQAVYYKKPFVTRERLDKVDYSYEDFLKFDSINANYVNTQILVRYR